MSQGNAGAAIGLANSNKIPFIGSYVQASTPPPGPEAADSYVGVNGYAYWPYNPVQESDYSATNGFVVNSNSGVAAGKAARLVSTGASPMTVAADGLCSVSAAGVVTATPTTGLYKTYLPPALVIPASSFLWVFLV
jgi:hypothetical protein